MQNQEIITIIILGAVLALLLVSFIITMLFLYKKRQQSHQLEMKVMQEEYDQQILRVQFEMQEATLAEISNKLHDTLKNRLVEVITKINTLSIQIFKKKLTDEEIIATLKDNTTDLTEIKDEVRLTSHSLSTERIYQVGLIDAIKSESRRLKNNSGLDISFNTNEAVHYFFKQEESVYLFRMFQEIVGNIISHSKATTVSISIDLLNGNIFYLQIIDNGIGFDVNEKSKSKLSGIGLHGMQKRALQIGAEIIINSTINIGTTIEIKLPLTEVEKNKPNVTKVEKTQYSFN
jgi:signal transduction histidine kinase